MHHDAFQSLHYQGKEAHHDPQIIVYSKETYSAVITNVMHGIWIL